MIKKSTSLQRTIVKKWNKWSSRLNDLLVLNRFALQPLTSIKALKIWHKNLRCTTSSKQQTSVCSSSSNITNLNQKLNRMPTRIWLMQSQIRQASSLKQTNYVARTVQQKKAQKTSSEPQKGKCAKSLTARIGSNYLFRNGKLEQTERLNLDKIKFSLNSFRKSRSLSSFFPLSFIVVH